MRRSPPAQERTRATRSSSEFSLLLSRGIRRGIATLKRERGWWTALGAMAGVVLLAQLFVLLSFGVGGAENLLRSQTDLRLQVKSGASDQRIQDFFAAVQQQPYVEHAVYITKEQAFERERKRDPELVSFLDEFKLQNPFPDIVSVTLKHLSDYNSFAQFSRQAAWQDVVDPTFLSKATDQEQQVQELLTIAEAGRAAALAFLALSCGVLLLVLMELVRRRALARGEEIIVERLIGAHDLSILLPFATEGAILLASSFLLSILLLAVVLIAAPAIVPALGPGGVFDSLRQETTSLMVAGFPLVIGLEVLLIPVLAWAGAWLGMRPQLRSSRLSLATY